MANILEITTRIKTALVDNIHSSPVFPAQVPQHVYFDYILGLLAEQELRITELTEQLEAVQDRLDSLNVPPPASPPKEKKGAPK